MDSQLKTGSTPAVPTEHKASVWSEVVHDHMSVCNILRDKGLGSTLSGPELSGETR